MRKKLKYNSDYMSRTMDEQLEQIEDKLSALYANASYEMNAKLASFMKEYEKQDKEMLAKVEAEEMTKAEYGQWRNRQMLQTDHYKATIDSMTSMMVSTDQAAMALISGEMPQVVAQSYNFTQALGWKAAQDSGLSVGTFQVYNARTVQKLIKENPDILPTVDVAEDKKWNKEKINREITQGIIQGEPVDKVADRLSRVTGMDRNAAIRNARTSMTAAENMGRAEAADHLKEQGIPMVEVWSATYDDRTRDSHLMLDGTERDEDGYFGADFLDTPLRYPADPLGDPEEVYNCRCRLSLRLGMIDHSQDKNLYEEFMKEEHPEDWENLQNDKRYKEKQELASKTKEYQAVLKEIKNKGYDDRKETIEEPKTEKEAKDVKEEILAERAEEIREEKLPPIEELEPVSHLSSGSEGVVQGRVLVDTFERRSDEYPNIIDDVIDAQGYNGLPRIVGEEEFNKAVEESGFIAQRTYSAPDQETLDNYRQQLYYGDFYVNCSVGGAQYGQGMYCAADYTGTLSEGIKQEMEHYQGINKISNADGSKVTYFQMQNDAVASRYEQTTGKTDIDKSSTEYSQAVKYVNDYMSRTDTTYETFINEFNLPYNVNVSYTETLTLTPDAKILNVHEQEDVINYLADDYAMSRIEDSQQKAILSDFVEIQHQIDNEKDINKIEELYNERDKLTDTKEWIEIQKYRDEFYGKYGGSDAGVAATLMGYDAINAQGHGKSGSYTVVLNRTKVIFKEDK